MHCKWGLPASWAISCSPLISVPESDVTAPEMSTWTPNAAAAAVPSLWDVVVIPLIRSASRRIGTGPSLETGEARGRSAVPGSQKPTTDAFRCSSRWNRRDLVLRASGRGCSMVARWTLEAGRTQGRCCAESPYRPPSSVFPPE
ncbi:hypothetical protein CKAH01_08085 [Colletotrichum kahawae]|uniref:Uncharacterized protein n=1 Tax=Colletotrichum kahawae TaxID=34407 RepID=A0AAD9Y2A1_COLKA|nr:hypothetical protein CKAH01_08085 [Colletotrichum kahawae]